MFGIDIGVDATHYPHIHIDDSTQKYCLTKTRTVIGRGAPPLPALRVRRLFGFRV